MVQCCASKNTAALPKERRHFACFPIEVSENDDFYSIFGIRCMNFVRLSLAPNTNCRASYGKQRSKVTHFLDASTVYGSNAETARELRLFQGGKLRMFNDFGHDLLPLTQDKQACNIDAPGIMCFKSGKWAVNIFLVLLEVKLVKTLIFFAFFSKID